MVTRGRQHRDGRGAVGMRPGADGTDPGVSIDLTDDGLHIEDGGEPPELDDSDVDLVHQARYGTLENLIDAFVESFNAHDLDGALAVLARDAELPGLGGDLAGFPETIESIWQRRPNAILTRGLLEDEPVTVVWDVDETGAWQRIALFSYGAEGEDEDIGLIELIDDPTAASEAETDRPEGDVVEGAAWDEWYEGAET